MRTFRTISRNDLRMVCVENNYYTCGDNEEYSELLDMAHKKELTDELLEKIAKDIFKHSDVVSMMGFYGADEKEILESIAFSVVNAATTYIM